MKSLPLAWAVAAAIALLACTACGGSGTSPSSSVAQGAFGRSGDDASKPNISGEYAGTIDDSESGKGHIVAALAQHRNAVGGTLVATEGTTSISNAAVWTVSGGTTLAGSGAATVGTVACVYSMNAAYDTTHYRFKGSYKAVSGCSGQHGTYDMKQKCTYDRGSDVRRESGPKPC